MALLCHFPLDGRLDNLVEGSNITLTNNGAIVSNYGKLGQCYEFVANYLHSQNNPIYAKEEFSISFWFKFNTRGNFCFFCSRTSLGQGISVFYLNTGFRFDFGNSGIAGSQWVIPNTNADTVKLNKWHHAVFTRNATSRKFYLDGIKHAETAIPGSVFSQGNIFITGASYESSLTATNNFFNGALNDYKIFDHALSDAEVAGLVATRKLLNSDGVERIGKSIKKEMEKRGNKPYPLPDGATFAADFRKSLCAWTPTGMMEPLGYDRAYESETGVYKNSLSTDKKLDIQQTDKGVWIGYGSENLASYTSYSSYDIIERKTNNSFTLKHVSSYSGSAISSDTKNYDVNSTYYIYLESDREVISISFHSTNFGTHTMTKNKSGILKNGRYFIGYILKTGDNMVNGNKHLHLSYKTALKVDDLTTIYNLTVEKNPIHTPYIEKSRGISTLLYPHKFTEEGTTTVIKFYGKIHEGPYKYVDSSSTAVGCYFLGSNTNGYGISNYHNKKRELNELLTDTLNTIVIKISSPTIYSAYVNGARVGNDIFALDERESFESVGYTRIGRRGSDSATPYYDGCAQTSFSQLLHFNRELTEKEIEYISNNEIEIPYKELSPKTINQHIQKDTSLSWNSIRDNYDTHLIPNSSTDLPLKPSKTYIIIDSNGNRYKSKISATGTVSACTGSTNVLSNVSGMIRVTGSVTFPVSAEII